MIKINITTTVLLFVSGTLLILFSIFYNKQKQQIKKINTDLIAIQSKYEDTKNKYIDYKSTLIDYGFKLVDGCSLDYCLFEDQKGTIYGLTFIEGYYEKSKPSYGYEGFISETPQYRDQFVISDLKKLNIDHFKNYNHGENREVKVNIDISNLNTQEKYKILNSSAQNPILLRVIIRPQMGMEYQLVNVPFEIITVK